MLKQCEAQKKNGERCNGLALEGDQHCFYHSEATANERAKGRSMGGKGKSNEAKARKIVLAGALSAEEAGAKLGPVLDQVITGKLAPNVGTAAATIAKAIAAIEETTEIERRLAALEEAISRDEGSGIGRRGVA